MPTTKIAMKILLGIMVSASFILSGCATQSTTSGIVTISQRIQLPPGVPKRVGVIFSGQDPIDTQSSDQFAAALISLGFDVVERNHIDKIIGEQNLSSSGRISGETAVKIGKLTGVEGLFVGTVTGEKSRTWLDTHLNVNLVNTEDGRIIWGADVHDPRTFSFTSTDVKTSIVHTTRHAVKLLEQDLDKLR